MHAISLSRLTLAGLHRERNVKPTSAVHGFEQIDSEGTLMQIDNHRIISLSMVKNEQDIIEPFIRHNARYVDHMVIIDNSSVDETRRIALDCARELKTVIVADCDEFAYKQAERMTRLLHYCQSAFFADFVLLLDADEFISARDRQALVQALNSIPCGGAGLIPWRTFVLTPGEIGRLGDDPPRSFQYRRTVETPLYEKAVLRLDGAYNPALQIEQGNHAVHTTSCEIVPTTPLDDLYLMHFPVRSRSQLVAKSVVGWMAYLAKNPAARQEDFGFQWRDAFDRIARSSELTGAELCEMSMRYCQHRSEIDWQTDVVEDRPPSDYARRYSTGRFADPVAVIARSWERSLTPRLPVAEFRRPSVEHLMPAVAATAFDAVWHWDHFFLDVAPFRYIAEKHLPSSVLDIGCGIGAYLALFKRLGAHVVFGVDGVPADTTTLESNEYAVRDLACPVDLGRVFDCVVSIEVAEHLEAQHAGVLLNSIALHADRTIVFSAAEPGQPGHGHVNCQPISYWLAQWAERGWFPDLTDSLAMRCLATLSWFRRNLVVLRRGSSAEGAAATAVLVEIGERPFAWYEQAPGIRHAAFSERLPSPPAGYALQSSG